MADDRSIEKSGQTRPAPRQAEETSTELERRVMKEDRLEETGRSELWLGHFQQLTTLTLAGGAGLLVLLQIGTAIQTSMPFYVSLIACGIGLMLCLGGQARVLDDDGSSPELWKDLREIRRAVFLALAVAAVSFVVLILS